MSRYEAIFFDLDGTTIPNEEHGRPSPRVLEVITSRQDKVHLIPTTGRTLIQALPVINAIGATGVCIVGGGTILYDITTRSIIKRTTLPGEAVRAVLDICQHYPDAQLYIREEKLGSDPYKSHGHLIDDVELMMVVNPKESDIPEFGARLNAIPKVLASLSPSWSGGKVFNITHEDATKEHAVSEVLDMLGVERKNSIGIGDGGNDLHLFRSVGLKIAMGNASPDLKAAADEIAPSIDEDGLAYIIEKYA